MFYRLKCQFRKNLNVKHRELQLIYCKRLTCNWNKDYAPQKPFEKDIFYSNWQRKTLTVIRHLLSGPRHPILHFNIFFYVKLFATIILSWNSLKCILWYLLELSNPFIRNENSILPILIEKNFEQKIYFCLLKMRSIFCKEIQFFRLNLDRDYQNIFLNFMWKIQDFSFHTFWKKKTFGPRLPTLPYNIVNFCM